MAFIKNITIQCSVAIFIFLSAMPLAQADDMCKGLKPNDCSGSKTELLLCKISVYTCNTLQAIDTFGTNWLSTTDSSKMLASNQQDFADMNKAFTSAADTQLTQTGERTKIFSQGGSAHPNAPLLPFNSNQLSYTTLMAKPLIPYSDDGIEKGKALNTDIPSFISNLTGTNIKLNQPNPGWKDSSAKTAYQNFYNTLSAVQSYNSHALSGLYFQNYFYQQEQALTNKISDPNWFAQIGSEPLGIVLRHILMFNSMMFVQQERMLEQQREQIAIEASMSSLLTMYVGQTLGPTLELNARQVGASQ